MIVKHTSNDFIIESLMQDKINNLNVLGYLKYNCAADVYLFNNNINEGVIVGNKQQNYFFIATHNADFIQEFWNGVSPGRKQFSGVSKTIIPILQKHIDIIEPNLCRSYVFNGDFNYDDNNEYKDDSLYAEDVSMVYKYYAYKSVETIEMMCENIICSDSSCIRINGELASWCMVHISDGAMGHLYTKEKYHGQGMAKCTLMRLIKKLILKNIVPYAQIVESNYKCLNLIESIKGMSYTHDCVWFKSDK